MTGKDYRVKSFNPLFEVYKIPFNAIEKANISLKDKDNTWSLKEHSDEQDWDIAINGAMFSNGNPKTDKYYYWNIADLVVNGVANGGGNYSDKGIAFGNPFKGISAYWSTTANCVGKPVDFIGSAPTLIIDGKLNMDMKGLGISFATNITQRTAIGIDKYHVYILTTRIKKANLTQVAKELIAHGCLYALDADGGGSTSIKIGNDYFTQGRNITSAFGIKLKENFSKDTVTTPTKPTVPVSEQYIAVLDAGHSASVSGKASFDNSYHEYECNINIVELLQPHLIRNKIKPIFIDYENANATAELNEIIRLINLTKGHICTSFHSNAYGEVLNKANGWEVFYYDDARYPNSKKLATAIHSEISVLNLTDRGIKVGNHLRFLSKTNPPSCLVETAFHTNLEDLAKLKTQEFRKLCALTYAKGIVKYFGLTWIDEVKEVVKAEPIPQTVYKIQLGAFKDKKLALALQLKLKNAGYVSIIVFDSVLNRVQVGAFCNKDNAIKLQEKLKLQGFLSILKEV